MPRPQRSWFAPLSAGLALTLSGTGCSAIWARTRISDAKSSVEAAGVAGAKQKAPYEYTNALLYLEKAREEEAYARFGPAIDLAEQATASAEQAKAIASGNAPAPAPSTPVKN